MSDDKFKHPLRLSCPHVNIGFDRATGPDRTIYTIMPGEFNPNHCTRCGGPVDSACGCPRGRAKRGGEEVWKVTRLMLALQRAQHKPRARLIKARSMGGGIPVYDVWMIYKEFNGRIVRGYGFELDSAIADYINVLNLVKSRDPSRWKL